MIEGGVQGMIKPLDVMDYINISPQMNIYDGLGREKLMAKQTRKKMLANLAKGRAKRKAMLRKRK
jgi:hypothetical protein